MKLPEIPVRLTVGTASACIGTITTTEHATQKVQDRVLVLTAHPDWRKSLADLLRATADEIDPPGEATT